MGDVVEFPQRLPHKGEVEIDSNVPLDEALKVIAVAEEGFARAVQMAEAECEAGFQLEVDPESPERWTVIGLD